MNTNSENPIVGRNFEIAVKKWFEEKYKVAFQENHGLKIGDPPKYHRFDLVSKDKKIAVECKCYTWTETGNVPSAKMGFANEAVFYLSFLKDTETFLVMKKVEHPRRNRCN
jgi:hypothetical protein